MAVNIQRQMNDCQGKTRFRHVVHGRNSLLNEDIETLISRMVDNIDSDDEMIANDTGRSSSGTYKKQIRGGQSCESTNMPAVNVDEEYRFHESSHCLQFSDLWSDQYNILLFQFVLRCIVCCVLQVQREQVRIYVIPSFAYNKYL